MHIRRYAAACIACLIVSAAAASTVPRPMQPLRIAPRPPTPTAVEAVSDTVVDSTSDLIVGPRTDLSRWPAVPPLRAVLDLLHAYSTKDLEAYARILTPEFRFFSAGAGEDEPAYVMTREEELTSALHLFNGVVRPSGEVLQAAREIRVEAGPFRVEPDPEFPKSRDYARVVALNVGLQIFFDEQDPIVAVPGQHEFYLHRITSAGAGSNSRYPDGEWRIRTWVEGAAPAPADRPKHVPKALAAAPVPVALPTPRLAMAPLQNPARGAFVLNLALAEPGPAHLQVLDVMGRRILSRDIDGSSQRFVLDPGPGLAAGVYWLRLSQGRASVITRVVLLK
jgi:hypothetical protein